LLLLLRRCWRHDFSSFSVFFSPVFFPQQKTKEEGEKTHETLKFVQVKET